jgi:hypothetical protein
MLHGIHGVTMVSILVTLAAIPRAASAQGSGDESGDARSTADEGKKNNGSRGSNDDKRRSDARGDKGNSGDRRNNNNDSRAAQGPLAVPSRINEAFTYPIGNGCQYSATVRGSVKTSRGSNGEEPRYTPSLTVNAWVTCQNNTELRVTDNALKDASMTRSQLEQAIEMRGSLLAESQGRRCVYLPDFTLGDGHLTAAGVSFLCPSGSAASLADNQDNGSRSDDSDSAPSDNRSNDGMSHDRSRDNRGSSGSSDHRDHGDNGRGSTHSDRQPPFDDGQ